MANCAHECKADGTDRVGGSRGRGVKQSTVTKTMEIANAEAAAQVEERDADVNDATACEPHLPRSSVMAGS